MSVPAGIACAWSQFTCKLPRKFPTGRASSSCRLRLESVCKNGNGISVRLSDTATGRDRSKEKAEQLAKEVALPIPRTSL